MALSIRGWLGGKFPDASDGPGPSVLAEWNKYSGGDDPETGNQLAQGTTPAASAPFSVGATDSSTSLSGSFFKAASGLQDRASTTLLRWTNPHYKLLTTVFLICLGRPLGHSSTMVMTVPLAIVLGAGESVGSVFGDLPVNFQVPTTQQIGYSAALFAAGVVFLLFAFGFALPVIVLAPAKFAFSFTIGCAMIMSAMAALRGWKSQVNHMLEWERMPFSICYLGSMSGTLYAAMVMHSYVLSIVCSAAQVVALLYYIMSYFPGGTAGVKYVLVMASRTASACFAKGGRLILG